MDDRTVRDDWGSEDWVLEALPGSFGRSLFPGPTLGFIITAVGSFIVRLTPVT